MPSPWVGFLRVPAWPPSACQGCRVSPYMAQGVPIPPTCRGVPTPRPCPPSSPLCALQCPHIPPQWVTVSPRPPPAVLRVSPCPSPCPPSPPLCPPGVLFPRSSPQVWPQAARQPPGLLPTQRRAFSNNKILVELDTSSGTVSPHPTEPHRAALGMESHQSPVLSAFSHVGPAERRAWGQGCHQVWAPGVAVCHVQSPASIGPLLCVPSRGRLGTGNREQLLGFRCPGSQEQLSQGRVPSA